MQQRYCMKYVIINMVYIRGWNPTSTSRKRGMKSYFPKEIVQLAPRITGARTCASIFNEISSIVIHWYSVKQSNNPPIESGIRPDEIICTLTTHSHANTHPAQAPMLRWRLSERSQSTP
jgi:hypothetical protein